MLFLLMQCASDLEVNLENARFALDSEDYAAAISAATDVLEKDPERIEAARILASAYMGRGGFSMHDIAAQLLDLQDAEDNNYRVLAEVVPEDGVLTDIRLAIESLEGLDGIGEDVLTTEELKDAAYDLGLINMIYHYAVAIYHTNFKSDPAHYDVDLLDDDTTGDNFSDLDEARDALVEFDNYLIAAGFDSDTDRGSFINEARQTHCLLQGVSDDEGYSLATFRALVQCSLSEDSEAETPNTIDPNFTDCSLSDPDNPDLPDEVIACFDQDTVIE